MLKVAQDLGVEGHEEKQEDEVTPALLKAVHSVLLRHTAKKGDLDKLVELIEHGANLEATDKVREGSEVVMRSWWWRECGGEVTVIRDPLGRSIRWPHVPSVVPRGAGWRRGAGRA